MFNNFLELAEARYSVRQYSDKPIEQEKLDRILRAGQVAPTAMNAQPQRILVLKSNEAVAKIRTLTRFHFNAPMYLLICANTAESYKAVDGNDSAEVDTAIVTTHMMMQAFDEGIGTCWVRGFDANMVSAEFGLPEHIEPVALLPIGYPAEDAKPYPGAHEKRKSITETVKYL